MVKRSFFYSSAFWYKLGLLFVHGKKNLKERYRYIASKIEKGDDVLEPLCGPAILLDYLNNDFRYNGFDLNKNFIKYAQKKHRGKDNIEIILGSALDPDNYKSIDVVVFCDALQTLGLEKEKKAINYAYCIAKKKVIICEPFKDLYLKSLCLIPNPLKYNILEKYFDFIQRDGINEIKLINVRTEQELKQDMDNGFGIIHNKVKRDYYKVHEDMIVTYYINQ